MIPFYRPYFNHAELLAALQLGPGRSEFEVDVAQRVGAQFGTAFAYGRAGIIAVLKALDIKGADVVVPAYACLVVAQAVMASGNRPVFVDITPDGYNLDVNRLKQALTPQTRAIIAVHLYGYPINIAQIRTAVGDNKILIIEDCAQSMLSPAQGTAKQCGDVGVFSFSPSKQLSTVRGGVITTNSPEFHDKIRAYRDSETVQVSPRVWAKRWGWFLASYLTFNHTVYNLMQRAGLVGWGSRESEGINPQAAEVPADHATAYLDFQARIGRAQLLKLDTVLSKRRALAKLYDAELQDVPGIYRAPIVNEATYSYYTIRVKDRDKRAFAERMLARGINVDQSFDYVLPLLKPYRAYASAEYPYAEQAARQVVNLPNYPDLSLANARYIAQSVRHSLEEAKN